MHFSLFLSAMTNTKLPINIQDLLRQRTVEGERIEYKKGWNKESILHTICAFANDFHNLGGGYILIGIEEKQGVPQLPPAGLSHHELDRIQKELLQLEKMAIQPSFNTITAVYELEGKLVLVLWVPGGEVRPYKAKVSLAKDSHEWAYFIRKHSSTVMARGADEQELIGLANKVPFDDRCRMSASLDDLQPHLMRDFLAQVKSDLSKDSFDMTPIELSKRMNVVCGTAEALFPKNVGLMFFNNEPHRFFPYTQIDVVYFPDGTGGDIIEEKVFYGPLGQMVRDALRYIDSLYIREKVVKYPHKPEANRFFNYPIAAIEEAVVNAIYHRSYEIREPIEVRIEKDNISVLSFPGPDRSIRMEDLASGRAVSRRYRNRRIGEFLKELELTEGRSTGIPKILRVMRRNGSPDPIFETDEDRTYFLIRLPIHKGMVENSEDGCENVIEDVVDEEGEGSKSVSPHVLKLLQFLNAKGELSSKELMDYLQITHRQYFSKGYLKPAVEQGFVEPTIADKLRSPFQKYRLTRKGIITILGSKE